MDDGIDAADRRPDGVRVGQRRDDQLVGQAGEVGPLADRQVVEDPDAIAGRDQSTGEVRADEPGATA